MAEGGARVKEPGFASPPFERRQYIERRADHLPVMILYRSEADLAYMDPSIDPSDRELGSNYGPRPDRWNYSQDARVRSLRPDAYLSTMSGTASYARLHDNIKKVTVPTLVLGGTADRGIFRASKKRPSPTPGPKTKRSSGSRVGTMDSILQVGKRATANSSSVPPPRSWNGWTSGCRSEDPGTIKRDAVPVDLETIR